MAKVKQLPIYKEAQRLVSVLHDTTRKAPRDLRHTLVQKLLSESVELIVDIDSANKSVMEQRVAYIHTAQQRVARLDILLFVSLEQRCLSKGAATKAMEHIDALGKQVHGWEKNAKNQVARSEKPESRASK